ncbi:MAG TPA: T9SS type A sorting domain-containing protein [Candidatus Marinimicrobia bacterium]|nr:T9SS type A sorting domain-containing protein [Candidatus Neomarinimicrobiota bacterium]
MKYDLLEGRYTVIQVYDILGKQIRTLIKGHEEAGFKTKVWDGTDDLGRPMSAGVYLYQIQAGEFTQTRKMMLLK